MHPKKTKYNFNDLNLFPDVSVGETGTVAKRKHDGKSCKSCGYVNEKKSTICDRCDQPVR